MTQDEVKELVRRLPVLASDNYQPAKAMLLKAAIALEFLTSIPDDAMLREVLAEELEKHSMPLCAGFVRSDNINEPMSLSALAAMARVARPSPSRDDVLEEAAMSCEEMVGSSESMLEAAAAIRALKSTPDGGTK